MRCFFMAQITTSFSGPLHCCFDEKNQIFQKIINQVKDLAENNSAQTEKHSIQSMPIALTLI